LIPVVQAVSSAEFDGIRPLLAPLAVRGCRLANRFVMAPMTRNSSPCGTPTDDVASYYARRAATGLGLVITEGVGIAHAAAVDHPCIPLMHGEKPLEGWRKVVEAVHAVGGVIFPQLWHQGVMWNVEYAANLSGTPMRPSGIWGPADGTISIPQAARERALATAQPMTDNDIQDVIDAYARAVALAGNNPQYQVGKAEWTKQLTTLYKFRHENSDAGLSAFIAGVLATPMPQP